MRSDLSDILVAFILCTMGAVLGTFVWILCAEIDESETRRSSLHCTDAAGNPSLVIDTQTRWWLDRGAFVGVDERGGRYVFTPPPGFLCKIVDEVEEAQR